MMKYRPDIDGLRAIAVLPVVFYHAGLPGFSGGFVGVDVFFVISGYLITRIIHDEMLEGRFSILSFYERRARRILPALFVVLAASLAAGWLWLAPDEYGGMARSAGATLLFVSNMWFWQNSGGYFEGGTDYFPLLHTWSLAVEEQFYIGFPLLLIVLVRLGRRATLGVTLALVVVSLALAIWATPRMPSASFYLLPTRIWELGIGSLLALELAPGHAPRWAREAVAALGLAAIGLAVTLYDGATSFPGLAALPPVLGAAALIWAGGHGQTLAGRLLSWRPVVFIGLLSYSLYLWHWPIMAFARNRLFSVELPAAWQAGTILLAFAAAWASWRFVERPFRAGQTRSLGRGPIFALSGLGMGALGAAAALVFVTGGVESRFSTGQLAREAALIPPNEPDWRCNGIAQQVCDFGGAAPGTAPSWAVWGDSHADSLLPAIGSVAAGQGRTVLFSSKGNCPPFPGLQRSDMPPSENATCSKLNQAMLKAILDDPQIETVFLGARWGIYVEGTGLPAEGMPLFAIVAEANPTAADPELNGKVVLAALEELATKLQGAGKNLVLVGPVPEMSWHAYNQQRAAALFGVPMPGRLPELSDIANRQARTNAILMAVARQEGVLFIPLSPSLCRPVCPIQGGQLAWYRDNNHLTAEGALRLVAPILAKFLANWPATAAKAPETR